MNGNELINLLQKSLSFVKESSCQESHEALQATPCEGRYRLQDQPLGCEVFLRSSARQVWAAIPGASVELGVDVLSSFRGDRDPGVLGWPRIRWTPLQRHQGTPSFLPLSTEEAAEKSAAQQALIANAQLTQAGCPLEVTS